MHKKLVWHKSSFSSPQPEIFFQTIFEALLKIASQTPDSVALFTNQNAYTFKDLTHRVAGIAEEISKCSQDKSPIALVQKSGIDAIAAWFACSYLGRAFILLEPDHPKVRLLELIKEAGCSLVIVDNFTASIFTEIPKINLLISNGKLGDFKIGNVVDAETPAMIFPTSGSTGNPKLITYASTTILVKVQSSIELMQIPKGAKVLIAGSHSNYGFLHHALVFLLSGGAVCLADVKTLGFDAIIDSIQNQGVRHVRFTPSLFRKLALLPHIHHTLQLLQGVRFSGEPLLKSDLLLAQSVLQKNCLIQNVYGSTESSLFIWSYINGEEIPNFEIVPIGKIYPHSSFAIKNLEDDDSSKGELIIKSKFHALGDLKNGEIDTHRFPLLDNNSIERLYSTGDMVQQLPNGDLIVLGRLGRMVKIRGNRVFLNEIENHLRSITNISGAAVVDIDFNGDKELVGFITVSQDLAIKLEDIKLELAKTLPDFMIPKQIKIIKNIPLLQGGKVDYNFLISLNSPKEILDEKASFKHDFAKLIHLWDSVLWKGAHQFYADFLSLGGDSLAVMILIAKIEEEFGKKVLLEDFKLNSTLPALAMLLNIKIPNNVVLKVKDSLQIKLFAPSIQNKSKGIALAMPGYRGWTQAYSVHKSGILQDYDIWVAEYPVKKGFIIEHNQWWDAAQQIVQYIQSGKIPVPKVIFGFSFSGGLAWVVSRLLSGTTYSPKFLLMVDSPPIHRLKKYKIKALKNALENVAHIQPTPALHIKRANLFGDNNIYLRNYEWDAQDNICLQLDLPTVEHLEMINVKLLSLVKNKAIAFFNSTEINKHTDYSNELPDILGVHILNAFKGNQFALDKVIIQLNKGFNLFSTQHLMYIAILLHQKNYSQKAKDVMQFIVSKQPNSGTIQYLNRRLKRNSNLLLNKNIPAFIPHNLVDIELLLASNQVVNTNSKPLIIKYFFVILDFVMAFLVSNYRNIN